MKVRYDESFLFPNSQDDYRRTEALFPAGGLHGLDAVWKGYYDLHPDAKKYQQDVLANYTKLLASQKADLEKFLANPNLPGAGDSINILLTQIPISESQILNATEALREDPEINAIAEKNAADLAQKLNDAEMAKALAAQAQQSANFVIAYGSGEGADLETARILQQQADDYARQAAENKAAADNLKKQRLQQQAAEAAQYQIAQQQIASEASKYLADIIRPYVAAQPVVTSSVVAPATKPAAVQPSTQTVQNTQGSLKMRNISDIDIMVLDVQNGKPALVVGWPDGASEYVAIGNDIDPWLTSHGFTRANVIENPAYTNLLATQKTAVTTTTQAPNITLLALDVDTSGPILVVHYADGTVGFVAKGAEIDPWLTSHGYTRSSAVQTAAYANLLATQKAAVDTSTTTVQHVDTVTGTVSTGNSTTGTVTVTTPTGQTATGTGTVTAGGVTTTANPVTGTVTTTNPTTGVVTQTNSTTGSTVQTVTAAAGGAGNIAIFGLLGLLLLRGALK